MFKQLLSLTLILLCGHNFSFAQPELWGTTNDGGSTLSGTLFKLDTDGNNYGLTYDWQSLNLGKSPHTGLLQASNDKLYGVTFQDGPLFGGVLFEYDYVTQTYTNKHSFIDATGSFPEGAVIQASNGKLYGLAGFGGAFSLGVLYEYDLSTNTYTNLVDFDGPIFGGGIHGSLVEAPNGNLYGVSSHGGTLGFGTIFEYNISTSTMTTKINLDSINSGYHPYGGLMLASNGKMYGLSQFGGTQNMGLMYEYDYVSNTITKLVDFLGTSNGSFPYDELFEASNGKLYGLTYEGGTSNAGTLFEYDIATNTHTVKFNFDGGINGSNPKGKFMESSNGKLYAYTSFGGAFNKGVLFEYDFVNDIVTKKLDFDGVNGVYASQNFLIEICAKPTILISSLPNDSICDGESVTLNVSGSGSSYTWDNGVSTGTPFIPVLGTTTYTTSSTNACGTSTASIDIVAKPKYETLIIDSICSGDSYIFPDGSVQSNITSAVVDTVLFSALNTCDSSVITNLFVKPKYLISITDTICTQGSYTFPDGSTQTNITTTVNYTSNLQTTLQCDSIIQTIVLVAPDYIIKDSVFVCDGDSYTFPDGFIENNIVIDVTHTSNLTTYLTGCDSVIVTTVTPKPIWAVTDSVQICSGDDYLYPNGSLQSNITSNVTQISTISSIYGCDSVITTVITVNPIFLINQNINLCYGEDYTFPDGLLIPNIISDTTHISSVASATSCDTLITTNIFINPTYTNVVLDTICKNDSYTFPDGVTINNVQNNTNHLSLLSTVNGCDSSITTSLAVSQVSVGVTTIGQTQLYANATSVNYQWMNCGTNTTVNGTTNQLFVANENGSYAVIISNAYCIDTSICNQITTIGIEELSLFNDLVVYPNPTSNYATILFNAEIDDATVNIYGLNGQILKSNIFYDATQFQLDLTDFENGTYIIEISSISETIYLRIIKN